MSARFPPPMRLDAGRFAISAALRDDALSLRLPPLGALLALRRGLDVPYARIRSVEAAPPEWPHLLAPRVGAHVPRLAAAGTFLGLPPGRVRFCYFARDDDRVLRLRLRGMRPDVVEVAVPQPDYLAREIGKRAGLARR